MKKYRNIIIIAIVFFVVFTSLFIAYKVNIATADEGKLQYMTGENLALRAKIRASYNNATAKSVADKSQNTYWLGKISDSYIEFDFGKTTPFNTVIINETGDNVAKFTILSSNDGLKYTVLYTQERIETQRLCALKNTVNARFLRIEFLGEASPKINTVGIYNEPINKSEGFRKVGTYAFEQLMARVGATLNEGENLSDSQINEIFDGEKLDIYDTVNLDGAVWCLNSGEFAFSETSVHSTQDNEIIQSEERKLFETTLNLLKRAIGARNTRINVTLSGMKLSSMDSNSMENLRNNIIKFVKKYEFDGVNFAFMHFDKKGTTVFGKFLTEVKSDFNSFRVSEGRKLELFVSAKPSGLDFNADAINAIDYFVAQGYGISDQNGDHSAFFGGGVQAIDYCLRKGFKKEQLILGVSFYGEYVEGKGEQYPFEKVGTSESYNWFGNIYTIYSGRNLIKSVHYNGGQMIYDKTTYAIYYRLKGISAYNMGADKFGIGENTLSYALNKAYVDRVEVKNVP